MAPSETRDRRRFFTDRRGNVSIIFGFALIPLVGVLGLALDYGVAIADKNKLDNAADSAALAAVATAKAYLAANPTDSNAAANSIAQGLDRAGRAFTINVANLPFAQVPTPAITLTRTGQVLKSTVTYATATQNHFGQLFGSPTMKIKGTSGASSQIPTYTDFYLLIDVSGSMGLPSTAAGMAALAAKNNDMSSDYQQGCQFACHFAGYQGYNIALANNIQLRSGAVNSAVCSLLSRASAPSVPSQYRVGLYPFIDQMATLTAITGNFSSLNTAAQCGSSNPLAFTQLLDTGTTQLYTNGDPRTGTGSGGTHFESALSSVQSTITSFGDGSSPQKSKPFVFIITDGMQNGQHFFTMRNGQYTYPGNPSSFPGYAAAWWDGSSPSALDPSQCASLLKVATVSILYIPYNQISFIPNGGNVAQENATVNAISPSLPAALVQCATSPGYFYTANSPTDITNALNAMFNQAVQVSHLSQ